MYVNLIQNIKFWARSNKINHAVHDIIHVLFWSVLQYNRIYLYVHFKVKLQVILIKKNVVTIYSSTLKKVGGEFHVNLAYPIQ